MNDKPGLQFPGQFTPSDPTINPGGNRINPFPSLYPRLAEGNVGSVISEFMVVVMYIAGFLSFIWFAWGVFEYIFAGGAKEGIGKARKRMTWAIVGFVIFIFSFALSEYAQTIFPTNPTPITNVRSPESQSSTKK